ncbi:hypothetical protein [Neochlamydia sp. S13]|uniref:hypothetical protein n=1 Tax=Neochlamydia sp. S13 TaxID=1353976 RepID=UPI0005AB5CAC|nr:hypothetical protein [Neochlamydia sp. S13]
MNLTRERQFFLWSVVGPLLALATLFIMLLRPTPLTPLLAFTLLLGLPVCWYLKRGGLLLAGFSLAFLLSFYHPIIINSPVWYGGITLSILLTFFITSYSYDTALVLIQGIQSPYSATEEGVFKLEKGTLESQHVKENAQEKIEKISQELYHSQQKNNHLDALLKSSQAEIEQVKLESEKYKVDAQAIKHELEIRSFKEEQLLQELLDKRGEVLQLSDQLVEVNKELAKRTEALKLMQDEPPLEKLRLQYQADMQSANKQLEMLTEELTNSKQEAQAFKKEVHLLTAELNNQAVRNERMLDELLEKRKEILYIKDQLQEAHEELEKGAGILDSHSAENIEKLKSQHQLEIQHFEEQVEALSQTLKDFEEKSSRLEKRSEQATQEIELAKQEIERSKDTVHFLQKELELKSFNEKEACEELEEEKKASLEVKKQLQQAQNELKDCILYHKSETQNLSELINTKDQEIFNIQFSLQSALEDLQTHGKELTQLQEEKIAYQDLQEKWANQIEDLHQEKISLKAALTKLQDEVQQFKGLEQEKVRLEEALKENMQELEAVRLAIEKAEEDAKQHASKDKEQKLILQSTPTPHEEYALRRRAEGMYLQLKEQFNDKSTVLEHTRQKLFYAEEKISQLQLLIQEKEQFNVDPYAQHLTQHIIKMQNQLDSLEKNYYLEVESLNEIITKLSL